MNFAADIYFAQITKTGVSTCYALNNLVLRYFSPLSGNMTTIVPDLFPRDLNRRVHGGAAAHADEMPSLATIVWSSHMRLPSRP